MKKLLLLPFLFLFFAISCDDEINDTPIIAPEAVIANKTPIKGNSFLVVSTTNKLPDNLAAQLATAKGTLTKSLSEIGVAVVTSDDADFVAKASKIKGIQAVIPNLKMPRIDPTELERNVAAEFANPPTSGDDDFFFDLQWGHDAVDAPEAWNAGYRGAGARVAVLDTGFDLDHPDLEPNINLNLSADMTGEGLQYTLPDAFSHGTHTAGTIAAADNGFGVIGIAPDAELVLVKVLYDDGWGFDSDVLNGMIHAVNVDADIISMSLGGSFFKSGEKPYYTAKDAAEFKNIYDRVVHYARVNGTIVIAAAGNDGADFDHTADLLFVPACSVNVVSVSATGPNGWALDPTTNLDLPAFYTNFGQSVIDFAGPGGTVDFDLANSGAMATVAGLTRPAYVFDFVFSTGNDGWFWSIGTSMATPHVAGVAALIVGKNGGIMDPVRVEAILRASADDLGKPGNDDFYGAGRVNALKAVSQ